MSAKTSHRRAQGTMKTGGRPAHIELDMAAWVVANSQGIDVTVYTLGERPNAQAVAKVVKRG